MDFADSSSGDILPNRPLQVILMREVSFLPPKDIHNSLHRDQAPVRIERGLGLYSPSSSVNGESIGQSE